MPKYEITVEYRGKNTIEIEADNKDDAIDRAIDEMIDINLHVYDVKVREVSNMNLSELPNS